MNCNDCGTKLEIILEHASPLQQSRYEGIPVWYCPKCKAGCGELTDKEIDMHIRCEDCGWIHVGMSCYDAEKKFGKRCNL